MRLFKINDTEVDLDDKTSIGITFQTYDIKEPGKRKSKISNTFTIPKTANNMAIIGFAGDPQFTDTSVYDAMYCEYWVDNEKLIDNAKVRVMEIGERISLFVFQKDDVWDTMKTYLWPEFVVDFLQWLQDEKGYPDEANFYEDTLTAFLSDIANNTSGLILPMYYGNLYQEVYNEIGETKTFAYSETQTSFVFTAEFTYSITNWDSSGSNNVTAVEEGGGAISYPLLIEEGESYSFEITKSSPGESAELSFFGEDVFLEDFNEIWLKYYPEDAIEPKNGGHFCAFVKSMFEFLEYKYSVNFCVNEADITGNIWDDTFADEVYIPMRDIDVLFHYDGATVDGFYFSIVSSGEFSPEEGLGDKTDKSVYDMVNAFFQHFNIIKDDIDINGASAIRLARFDDIKTMADVVKFSGIIEGVPKFKPYVDGFVQENIIKFDSVYPEGGEYLSSRTITCHNKNLDATQELFSIDSYIPSFISIMGGLAADLSTPESFDTFTFFISSGLTSSIDVHLSHESETITATLQLPKAALYSLSGEYTFLAEIMAYPKFYDIEKWLTLNDINNIEFFKQYYIQELNGSYFINKISGFNPQKSNSPTKIEVIRISDQVAIDYKELQYYTDGIDNIFTDGLGNKFF